ncbi:MAG: SPOR domain-containing protein [Burkholderiales bacterium]|nr:SPOR domain-containing protein [Burkholderiales bacterium]
MKDTRHLRSGLFAVTFLACAALLSACSLWPAGPSAPAETAPAELKAQAPAATSSTCADCIENVKSAPVVVAQSPTAPVALSPLPPASAPAVTEPAARAPVAASATSVLAHGFYVNAGLYAVPGNASKAYSKLEGAGLPVFTEVVASTDGQRTRVRVGPYPTRAKADAAAKKIRALKLDVMVFKY